MKVLSLFDGMACGMIAMQLAGVDVESYDAYEIDKYAIKTAQHNFPMIKEHGDVFGADFTQYEGVDFLIGGSPCTYWSIAQTKNRETVASGMGWELFSQYVRALKEAKPKYFIYENNKSMSKQIRESIDDAFGFEAICINSALVSAQNRQRLYWVGKRNADGTYSRVNVEQPADRGILLKDVLDSVVARDLTCNDKSYTRTASYDGACAWNTIERHQRNMVAEPINVTADGKAQCLRATCYKDGIRNIIANDVDKKTGVAEPINVPHDCDVVITENSIRCQRRDQKHSTVQGSHVNFTDGKTQTLSPSHIPNVIEPKSCGDLYAIPTMPIKEATAKGYTEIECGDCVDLSMPNSKTRRGRNMADKANCMQTSNEFYQYVGYVIEFDDDSKPIKAIGKDGKEITIYEVKDGKITIKGKQYPIKLKDNQIMEPLQYEELSDEYYKGCADGNLVGMIENEGKYKNGKQPSQQYRVYSCEDKSVCVDTGQRKHYIIPYSIEFDDDGKPIKAIGKDGKEINAYEVKDGKITIKGKQYPIKLKDGYYIIRKLTVSECKRLQTVPEWYEFPVSNSQAYKMLGNGWTCEVIAHLIRACVGGE